MDEQDQKFYSKLVTLICCTTIVIAAFCFGYDGNLATVALVGLFGGEKVIDKLVSIRQEKIEVVKDGKTS